MTSRWERDGGSSFGEQEKDMDVASPISKKTTHKYSANLIKWFLERVLPTNVITSLV